MDNLPRYALIAFIIAVSVTVIVLFVKFIIALFVSPLDISFLLGFFNLVLSAIAVILGIAGPILVIITLGHLILWLFNQLLKRLDIVRTTIIRVTGDHSERVLPVIGAGLVEVLLLAVSSSVITNSAKLVLSIYLWTFASILVITTAPGIPRRKAFGFVGLFVITVVPAIVSVLNYRLYDRNTLSIAAETIRQYLIVLSASDRLAISLVCFFVLAMLVVSLYYGITNVKRTPA